MKPYVSYPPKNHNNSDVFLLKAESWKDAYILYENVKVLPNLVQTFVLLLISKVDGQNYKTINMAY